TQGFYYVYHYWPVASNKMIYESTLYFPPARSARDRVAQEMIALNFKDFGLQDVNTCEATQQMLESRAVERFPSGDQEVLCRHMHKQVYEAVEKHKAEKGL